MEIITSNQHDAYGKYLLAVGGGRNVAKPNGGQTAEGEVQRRYVARLR